MASRRANLLSLLLHIQQFTDVMVESIVVITALQLVLSLKVLSLSDLREAIELDLLILHVPTDALTE